MDINLPLTQNEAMMLYFIIDDWTDENKSIPARKVLGRLEDLLHEYKEKKEKKECTK